MFAVPIEVLPEDIDHMGHVNNSVYLRWVQKAVVEHWHAIAPVNLTDAYLWIARAHNIRYLRPGFLTDSIEAVVSIEAVRGVFASYVTRIMRGPTCLAEIKSQWCCLDADSRRPARIPEVLLQRVAPTG